VPRGKTGLIRLNCCCPRATSYLNATRDWGHARDYVEGMWLTVQQEEPDDYVLATGEAHSVREFVEKAFAHVGRTILRKSEGIEDKGIDRGSGKVLVEIDPRYFRPTEVDCSWRCEKRTINLAGITGCDVRRTCA
jgi:GDP-mannose 4,6-dehydratase